MNLIKETRWLCEHARLLEKFSGQNVMFNTQDGLLTDKKKSSEAPFLFHVPSRDELTSPVPVIRSFKKSV